MNSKTGKIRKTVCFLAACLLAAGAAAAIRFSLAGGGRPLSDADAALFQSASPAPGSVTLSLDAAPDGAEFCLLNGSGGQLDTSSVNRLEKRSGTGWETVCGSIENYPPGIQTLQAGQTLYGMTGWPEAGITLTAGEYRYQMVVYLWDENGRTPATVECCFTIA